MQEAFTRTHRDANLPNIHHWEGHLLLPIKDTGFVRCDRTTTTGQNLSESERHPISVGCVVVVGIPVVVDIATVRRIATIDGRQPPVGALTEDDLKPYFLSCIVLLDLRHDLSKAISLIIISIACFSLFTSIGRVSTTYSIIWKICSQLAIAIV